MPTIRADTPRGLRVFFAMRLVELVLESLQIDTKAFINQLYRSRFGPLRAQRALAADLAGKRVELGELCAAAVAQARRDAAFGTKLLRIGAERIAAVFAPLPN